MQLTSSIVCVLLLCAIGPSEPAFACPFCSALASSLREEIAQLDHFAIAVCVKSADVTAEAPLHSFRLTEVLKRPRAIAGQQPAPSMGSVILAYPGRACAVGDKLLLYGLGQEEIAWATSEPLSPTAIEYVRGVISLHRRASTRLSDGAQPSPKEVGDGWLNLYWDSLASTDRWIRRDAYNAMATVSIAQLRPWASGIDASKVRERICDPGTSGELRRFYWTVLSLCGSATDATFVHDKIFEQLIEHESVVLAKDRIGLDSAISCYLLLGGEHAKHIVVTEVLANSARHASARYAALSALRVHAEEFAVLDKKQIGDALAILLNDSAFVDIVIPDLARLEDWRHIDVLQEKFKAAEADELYLRVAITNYLRFCPLPQATDALAVCEMIDPNAVRRAKAIFPLPKQAKSGG